MDGVIKLNISNLQNQKNELKEKQNEIRNEIDEINLKLLEALNREYEENVENVDCQQNEESIDVLGLPRKEKSALIRNNIRTLGDLKSKIEELNGALYNPGCNGISRIGKEGTICILEKIIQYYRNI